MPLIMAKAHRRKMLSSDRRINGQHTVGLGDTTHAINRAPRSIFNEAIKTCFARYVGSNNPRIFSMTKNRNRNKNTSNVDSGSPEQPAPPTVRVNSIYALSDSMFKFTVESNPPRPQSQTGPSASDSRTTSALVPKNLAQDFLSKCQVSTNAAGDLCHYDDCF